MLHGCRVNVLIQIVLEVYFMCKNVMIALMIFIMAACVSHEAAAQTVTTQQALYFGEWVFYNNNAEYEIVVNTNGDFTFDSNGLVLLTEPREGIYDIDGYTPGAEVISVVVTQASPLTKGGSTLTVDDFRLDFPQYVDGDGHIILKVGGVANTTATGVSYVDGIYTGSIDVDITF